MTSCPASLATAWQGTQGDLWRIDPGGERWLRQPGGWLLPEPFDLPLSMPGDPVDPGWQGAPQIETFLVDSETVRCTPMGQGRSVDWWADAVRRFATTIHAALTAVGVGVEGSPTITASVTDLADVNAEPHIDDATYRPEAGVGVVAIAGTGAGPRALTGSVPIATPEHLSELGPDIWSRFGQGAEPATDTVVIDRFPANRIALFAQFGQIHAGPSAADLTVADAFDRRSLLVYRAATAPRVGSGPT